MKQEHVLDLMDNIDPALVEEVELTGRKKRRLSAPLRAGLIAACVCLALVGATFAAEVMGVRIADFLPGGEEQAHYDVLLDGVKGIPLDSLPEEILAIPRYELIDYATVAEAEEALGMELAGFAPFEVGAVKDKLHVSMNEGPVHHSHCLMMTWGPEGEPDIIEVSAGYDTYPPQREHLRENSIWIHVSASIYTESGLERYDNHFAPFPGYIKGSELELGSFTAPDGQEIPIISDKHPIGQLDEEGVQVGTVEGNSIHAYYIQDGVLYSVTASGRPGVEPEELRPALESILGGLST